MQRFHTMSTGWFDIEVQLAVYTRMVYSKVSARACLELGAVIIRKVVSEGSEP